MAQSTEDRGRILAHVLEALGDAVAERAAVDVAWREHSHVIGRIELDDGRVLMVKLGRFEWAAAAFHAERRAAELVRGAGIDAPEHLPVPPRIEGRPVLCYWRIQKPTLATRWPSYGADERSSVLRSWGALLRRIHSVPMDGFGRLGTFDGRCDTLRQFLEQDLRERLRPALVGEWPAAVGALDAALASLPELDRRVGGSAPVLLHGDPNARNLLCAVNDDPPRCDGVIDLESAMAGPPALDLALAALLHGALFAQPLPDGWFDELTAGYGRSVDPFALRWFGLYHLLNLGFFSAHIGDDWHAAAVARAADARARALRAGRGTPAVSSRGERGGTAPAAERRERGSGSGGGRAAGSIPRHR